MKRFFAISLALSLVAANALASGELVKQKALQQRDINNQQQGVPPPFPSARSQAPAAPAGPQGISAAQQQLIDKLAGDLAAIKPGSTVTGEQKKGLQEDCSTLAKGTVKPSKASLTNLVNDLSAALAGKEVSFSNQAALAKDINIVVNSMNLSATQVQTFVTAAQKALKAGGVSDQATQSTVADLKAIVTELQKNKPKLYQ